MCDTLLCIHRVFTFMYWTIYVIVISTWPWYMTCVLSTLNDLYVISFVLCSFAFASTLHFDANELYYLYSCLIHIFWVHHVGLGHISLPNALVRIDKSLYEPCISKNLTLFTYSMWYCHQSPKRGRLKASRPLVGFRWLVTIQDYYD